MSNINLNSFLRFLLVGGGATGLQYLIMWALVAGVGMSAVPASNAGFLISAAFNYWANARFTFQGGGGGHQQNIPRFLVTLCAGLLINSGVLHGLLLLNVPIWLAQLCATGVVFIWNYTVNAVWTFRKRQ
ncbi:GtrA family protein [Uliginosibacterium sp. H3]|uniref:GtrA family protein n=1 Tax=Uliginosibacterium silvisoli TaxID=3114758 RepID=A0ABU6K1M8_9RHOO|nr:GtrA family protein [Uliginosibacterium sp. H3]